MLHTSLDRDDSAYAVQPTSSQCRPESLAWFSLSVLTYGDNSHSRSRPGGPETEKE